MSDSAPRTLNLCEAFLFDPYSDPLPTGEGVRRTGEGEHENYELETFSNDQHLFIGIFLNSVWLARLVPDHALQQNTEIHSAIPSERMGPLHSRHR